MTAILLNNRQIQKELEFYTSKSELSEALFECGKAFSLVTMKYISHFKYTDGGVTQASVKELCKLSGISTSTYSETVKPEIETLLGEPIIHIEKTQKNDKSRTKKVKGCTYKILIPLKKIKYLIMKYLKKKRAQELAKIKEIRARISSFSDDDIQRDLETDIKPDAQDPRPASAEDDFPDKQNKSFRENLSDKDLNNLIKDDQNFKISSKIIGIKKEVKNYLNTFPLFRDFSNWSQAKIYEVSRTLQLAIVKHGADLQDTKIQYTVAPAIRKFYKKHFKKPQGDFLRLFYTYVSNALKNTQVGDPETNKSDSGEYETLVPREILEKRAREAKSKSREKTSSEDLGSREDLDAMRVW